MGSPGINNYRNNPNGYVVMPDGAAPSTPAQSRTGRADETRTPQPARSAPARQELQTERLLSFLQEFSNLDELYAKYPEFEGMTFPALSDDAATAFEAMAGSLLGKDRYGELAAGRTPMDILRGISELRERQGGGRVLPKANRKRKEERMAEAPRTSARTSSRRQTPQIWHHTVAREHGLLQARHPFARVGHDHFARWAIWADCEIGRLSDYHMRIKTRIRHLRTKHPECSHFLKDLFRYMKNSLLDIKTDLNVTGYPLLALGVLLGLESEKIDFFYVISCLEGVTRFLDWIESEGEKQIFSEKHENTQIEFLDKTHKDLSKELLKSMLLFANIYSDNDAFNKELIISLLTLLRTKDFNEAGRVFKSAARLRWPDDPSYAAAVGEGATDRVKKAAAFAREVSEEYRKEAAQFGIIDLDASTALVAEISYYCSLHVTRTLNLPYIFVKIFGCVNFQEPDQNIS